METARMRETLFTILASLFLEAPSAALVETLWPLLVECTQTKLESSAPPSVASLQKAFTRHWIGPGKDYVPPYASIYLHPAPPEKPLLWGMEAVVLQSEYEAAGLRIAPGGIRIPDHLGVELQFMAYLCRREAEAWENGDTIQAQDWRSQQEKFTQRHLLNWLPLLSARLRQVNAHPFYCMAMEFLEKLLRREIELEIREP